MNAKHRQIENLGTYLVFISFRPLEPLASLPSSYSYSCVSPLQDSNHSSSPSTASLIPS